MKSNYTKSCVQFKGRNVNAYSLIYLQYSPVLLQFAIAIIKDPSAANDIVTDVFEKLLQGDFDKMKGVKIFLFLTTYTACLAYQREKERDRRMANEIAYLAVAEVPSRYENTAGEERIELVKRLLEQIPQKCRLVCKLILAGLSTAEIAEKLGISKKTVQSHKEHAVKKLRELVFREANIF